MGIFSFVLTLLATLYSAKEDFEHHQRIQGYVYMTLNCLTTAGYVLYLRYAIKKTKFTRFGAAYYNNVLSIPILFILVCTNSCKRDDVSSLATKSTADSFFRRMSQEDSKYHIHRLNHPITMPAQAQDVKLNFPCISVGIALILYLNYILSLIAL